MAEPEPEQTARPQDALKGVPIVNLVIDIGDYDPQHSKMSREEHDSYIKGVRETADALRQQGIPTVWVAIHEQNTIHDKWDADTVEKYKMTSLNPQPGDIIFEKRFMSGFLTKEGIEADPALKAYVINQQRGGDPDYTRGFASGAEHTLTHLLKDAQHIIVNGGMGQFCVTDNSIDAALQGKGVTIVKDNVMVWETMGKWDRISAGDPDFSASQVKAQLDELRADPAKRALPEGAQDAIDAIKIKSAEETVDSIPAIRKEIASKQALSDLGSKYTAPAKDDAASPAKIPAAPSARAKTSMTL